MTDRTKLLELIEFASAAMERQFKHTGKVLPMYHAIGPDEEHFVIAAPDKDKDVSVAMVKLLFAQKNVQRYVFIDEAWIIDRPTTAISEGDMKRFMREGLEHHPDRREILMFSAEDRRGNMVMAHRYILRPEHGKATLSPLKVMDFTEGTTRGRMVGLLR